MMQRLVMIVFSWACFVCAQAQPGPYGDIMSAGMMQDSIAALTQRVSLNEVKVYDANGRRTERLKIWSDIVAVGGTSATVDYSSAGFTEVLGISAISVDADASSVDDAPLVSIASVNASSAQIFFYDSRTTGVVLGGVVRGLEPANTANVAIIVLGL